MSDTNMNRADSADETESQERAVTLDEHGAGERPNWTWVRAAVEGYYDFQQMRIATSHRLRERMPHAATQDPGPKPKTKSGILQVLDESRSWEKKLSRALAREVSGHVMWPVLASVCGIGPVLAAGIIAHVESFGSSRGEERGIRAMPTVSVLWRYAGLSVVNGRAERRVKGEKLHFSMRFKTLCWKIGESFVKASSGPYRAMYERYRAFYDAKWLPWCGKEHMVKSNGVLKRVENEKGDPICFDAHRYAAAKRATVKLFLAGVWAEWRKLEGLPVRDPYPIEKLGHTTIIGLLRGGNGGTKDEIETTDA